MNPLFSERLSRQELLSMPEASFEKTITIAVHRNHSFELVASVLNPFLSLARVRADFFYSDYDDSLSFIAPHFTADLHLLWLDVTRYSVPDVMPWLLSRLEVLRAGYAGTAKIIVALAGYAAPPTDLPDTLFFNCDAAVAFLKDGAYDARLEPYTGTRFSNQACLQLARALGTGAIPDMLLPRLKVLALDLDNTLHRGVLGEDGIQGVEPFTDLQRYILELSRQGFLLALVSRNEEEDVRKLFSQRPDFPLQWDDFAAHAIGWQPKSAGLAQIAATLNVGPDSLLFIDDNHGERLEVSAVLPEVRILPADGPEEVLGALHYFPGLHKSRQTVEDGLRSSDLKANAERQKLRASLSPQDYVQELGIELRLAVNDRQYFDRVYELLHKTNQFVLALRRPSELDLIQYYEDSDRCVVTASMRDKLSDSGLIATGLFRCCEPGVLEADELAVSCRALGRGVESQMLQGMIAQAADTLGGLTNIRLAYKQGARNTPGLRWLKDVSGQELGPVGTVAMQNILKYSSENPMASLIA